MEKDRRHHAGLPPRAVVLDLASGTGDFSKLLTARDPAHDRSPSTSPSACSNSPDPQASPTRSARTPASSPSRTPMFDAVFIGYGLRNFANLDRAIREIRRVTRPGGLLVSLDFFLPANRIMRALYVAYLYAQAPSGAPSSTVAPGSTRISPIRSGRLSRWTNFAASRGRPATARSNPAPSSSAALPCTGPGSSSRPQGSALNNAP